MRSVEEIDRLNAEIVQKKEQLKNVKGREIEVYTRIVGYYRAIKNWNLGRAAEQKKRKVFDMKASMDKKELDINNKMQ
ncbi:MAG: anaerobic ribonucleoside-triphosphate reductase [Patescibacteria group bacterium]|jgi:ribonucleoside-triphosphate reductase